MKIISENPKPLVPLMPGCSLTPGRAQGVMSFDVVEPKEGRMIRVLGPDCDVLMRRYFLLDVLANATCNEEGNRLPKKFRLMNPTILCGDSQTKESYCASSTTQNAILRSGNIAFASSGAFSKKQFKGAMERFRSLYGADVKVTVIDLRKEFHWFGDGEPFSYHTFTNHENMDLSLTELKLQEKKFINANPNGVVLWARRKDGDNDPVLRRYRHIQREEDVVQAEENATYIRMPVPDHMALDLETVKRLYQIVMERIASAQAKNTSLQILWFHCLGGKGRASSATLAAHVIARRKLSRPERPVPMVTFETLAKHIWCTGGKNLSVVPNSKKRYKINGVICRRGCLQALVTAAHDVTSPYSLLDRICHKLNEYCERYRELWERQIDLTELQISQCTKPVGSSVSDNTQGAE